MARHLSRNSKDVKIFQCHFKQNKNTFRDSESQSDAEALLKAAAMHLLILFCGDTEEGTNFLKTNLEIVLKNYDRSLENYLLQKYEYDDLRNQNVV